MSQDLGYDPSGGLWAPKTHTVSLPYQEPWLEFFLPV